MPPDSAPPPLPRSVLLADDSPVARLSIARHLRARGVHVIEASSASEALAQATGASLACALLDLDLGDRDGSDVASELRRLFPALPIAFFSASIAAGALARAWAMGPVFAKPSQLDDALGWVKQHARP